MKEQFDDLIAVYALGGLTDEEKEAVEAYAAENPAAQARLDEAVETAAALSFAAPPLTPSPALEQDLMTRVEADAAARFPTQKPAPPRPSPSPSFWTRLQHFLSAPLVTGTSLALATLIFAWALVLLRQNSALYADIDQMAADNGALAESVAAVTLENAALQEQIDDLQMSNNALVEQLTAVNEEADRLETQVANLAEAQTALENDVAALQSTNETLTAVNAQLEEDVSSMTEVMSLLNSPRVYQVSLPGTEAQPEAGGTLILDEESAVALLLVENLDPLGADQVYQVLLIRETGHETAETFAVDTQGSGVLLVRSEAPIDSFTAVGVSIEPEGGSPQRTGEVILLGDIVN